MKFKVAREPVPIFLLTFFISLHILKNHLGTFEFIWKIAIEGLRVWCSVS